MLRRFGIGAALALALGIGIFVALLSWGGVRIVSGDQPVAAPAQVRLSPEAASVVLPEGAMLRVPVAGVAPGDLRESWGDERGGGMRAHTGLDIPAPGGTLVIAAAPGVVEKIWTSQAGGLTAYVRSPQRRVIYYYAHLSGYAPGLAEGQAVRTGQPIGYVGDTGNAGAGNTHLHFGVSLARPEDAWHQGTPVDPYPLLAGKSAPR